MRESVSESERLNESKRERERGGHFEREGSEREGEFEREGVREAKHVLPKQPVSLNIETSETTSCPILRSDKKHFAKLFRQNP